MLIAGAADNGMMLAEIADNGVLLGATMFWVLPPHGGGVCVFAPLMASSRPATTSATCWISPRRRAGSTMLMRSQTSIHLA
eukprot:15627820-Heterocapsa_arctica.AAC.1